MRLRSTGWRPIAASMVPVLGLGRPPDQRLVDAGQVVGGEQLRQRLVGGVVLGHHHDPRGVLVEPMDDARPAHAADARQAVAAMGQQGVDQGVVGIAGRGMDDQPGRLVQHQQVGILVEDIEVDRLGLGLRRLGLRDVDNETVARFDLAGGLFYSSGPSASATRRLSISAFTRLRVRLGRAAASARSSRSPEALSSKVTMWRWLAHGVVLASPPPPGLRTALAEGAGHRDGPADRGGLRRGRGRNRPPHV